LLIFDLLIEDQEQQLLTAKNAKDAEKTTKIDRVWNFGWFSIINQKSTINNFL